MTDIFQGAAKSLSHTLNSSGDLVAVSPDNPMPIGAADETSGVVTTPLMNSDRELLQDVRKTPIIQDGVIGKQR